MALWTLHPSEPSPIAVTGVVLNPESSSVEIGSTVQLSETVSPVDASDKSVTFSSSDELVATVDSSGLVTGVAEGTATITVTTNDGTFTDTSNITVTDVV